MKLGGNRPPGDNPAKLQSLQSYKAVVMVHVVGDGYLLITQLFSSPSVFYADGPCRSYQQVGKNQQHILVENATTTSHPFFSRWINVNNYRVYTVLRCIHLFCIFFNFNVSVTMSVFLLYVSINWHHVTLCKLS